MSDLRQFANPVEQFLTDTGAVLAGGFLYFYEAGTTNPLDTYPTQADLLALTNANANPIELDSAGRPMVGIYMPADDYKIVLKTSAGVTIWTRDNYQVSTASSFTGGLESSGGSIRRAALVNNQTGTSYTILTGDRGKLVTFSNANAIAVTVPQANSITFPDGWFCDIENRGVGALTLTPTTSTIDGAASLIIPTDTGIRLFSDGTNYFTQRGYSLSSVVPPQGRLTLVSGTPVMTTDQTAKTAVYYTPHTGDKVPIYNGATFIPKTFTELTLTLNTANHLSTKQFDIFIALNGSTVIIGTGPDWSVSSGSATARGTGAGSTELQRVNGIWTNKNAITLTNDNTTYAIAANKATYVGTVYMTANGQTAMSFKPAAANGGNACILGLYNAYNRVRTSSISRDNTTSWSYGTATWRASDNSNSNRITFIDGLQQSTIASRFQCGAIPSSNASPGVIAINLDSTSATPNIAATIGNTGTTTDDMTNMITELFPPQMGLHYLQAMEFGVGGSSTTFFGVVYTSHQVHGLSIELEM